MHSNDFKQEIRAIIRDRIHAVVEELHRKGMHWADMFSEVDVLAISTGKIETIGETDKEAAENEKKRAERNRYMIELVRRNANSNSSVNDSMKHEYHEKT
ncbi:hypothetical protein DICVIV_08044 [Dictyocaulus viviparus]|uniref:Uncharacterized protein n=1 Tax=Dictyocaulus viviparus TaxID=29172 RepID=A0A0D8XQ22_DICVI|nr:hypothetical protein DICVIV_08044 [Dictyocaulus viviparus]